MITIRAVHDAWEEATNNPMREQCWNYALALSREYMEERSMYPADRAAPAGSARAAESTAPAGSTAQPVLSHGKKYDNGKVQWSLMPWEVLEEVAALYTRGAEKYSANNWKLVEDGETRYTNALIRHLVAHLKGGEDTDTDTGAAHIVSVAWNALTLRSLALAKGTGSSN